MGGLELWVVRGLSLPAARLPLPEKAQLLSFTGGGQNRGQVFLCAQIMSFMRKGRVLEDRVGEIRA